MLKRSLSMLLTVIMLLAVFTVVPASFSAEETDDASVAAQPTEEAYTEETPTLPAAEAEEPEEPADEEPIGKESGFEPAPVGTLYLSTPLISKTVSLESGVKIYWGRVPGAIKYRIFYYGRNGWTRMADVAGTEYLDSDVSFGKTYRYTVRCIDSYGNYTSGYDSAGKTHLHYLDTPKITKMSSLAYGVNITWDKVTNASKYRVYYKNRYGNWVRMGETTGTSFVDTDVSYGTTYTYTVRCITSDGKAFTSDCNSTGWKHTYYRDTPTISAFFSSGKGVVISWRTVGAAKYRVYYKNRYGDWIKMGESTGGSFTDSDVRVGTTYRYTVRAITSDGSKFTSDCNSSGWTYTYDPVLPSPSINSFETISTGVKISWGAVVNAGKYRVYYKNRNGNWVKMGDTSGTSYVDTVVADGTTYTYAVRCLAAKDSDFASSMGSAKSHTYIGTPSITKMESTSSGVKITWGAKSGATRYRVYYKNRNGSWVKMTETSSTSYLDTDVTDGTTYTYTVRCVNSSGFFTSDCNSTGWKFTYRKPSVMMTRDEAKNYAKQYWSNKVGSLSGYSIVNGTMVYTNGREYYEFILKVLQSGHFTAIDYVYVDAYSGACKSSPN